MIAVGDTYSETLCFDTDSVAAFAKVTGDDNPIHLDDAAARQCGFDRAIVHGMLCASVFSRILGTKFPGPGTVYLGQDLKFLAPIYVGETVTAVLEITSQKPGKPVFFVRTEILGQACTEKKVSGEAVIKFSGRPFA